MTRTRFATTLLILIATAVLIVSMQSIVYSQGQKVNWTIQKSNGEWLTNCLLDSLSGSTLSFHQDSLVKSVTLDSVAVLWSPDNSKPVLGLLVGAVVGCVAGYFIAPEPRIEQHVEDWGFFNVYRDETIDHRPVYAGFGAAIVGGLGCLIGSTGAEKVYDLRDKEARAKADIVSLLLRGKRR